MPKRQTTTRTVRVKFSRTGSEVLAFWPQRHAPAAFIDDLREVGASEVTIAAAEGRVDDAKRLLKQLSAEA